MELPDSLHGTIIVPDFFSELFATDKVIRMRYISLSLIPASILQFGGIPSRLHHSLGVAHNIGVIVRNNPELAVYGDLFAVASLLHDAGNPPFTHLSEVFLEDRFGKNGETFLENILEGSETLAVLKRQGWDLEQIIPLITGTGPAFAKLLHGSIDADNLDNVPRYAQTIGIAYFLDLPAILHGFKFQDNKFYFESKCISEVKHWQVLRSLVYAAIHTNPHLALISMLSRAMELAYAHGEITDQFFYLTDEQAFAYLSGLNYATSQLVASMYQWQWYQCCYGHDTYQPSRTLQTAVQGWKSRKELADRLAEALHLEPHKVNLYVDQGKDKRKVLIPFRFPNGDLEYDMEDDSPMYRCRVYLHPDCQISPHIIEQLTNEFLEL